ncbi:hypothetical protein OAA21_00650 [bacterium]|nr:hypothetical protein [bacterium]
MTTVPPAEIADATTFASSLTVQGAFTSPGIDDNADATALTIDSSENVLIGRTDSGSQTEGTTIYNGGTIEVTNASDLALRLNRKTNDGTIIELRKDAGVVGSIGVLNSNNVTISGTVADHGGLQFGTHSVTPMEANSDSNGTIDLGSSNAKFKDLYLSGGVYLGGTGSANKLDDAETGTWTPADSSGASLTLSVGSATYVKIGKFVMISFDITYPSTSTTNGSSISGLPFTVSNTGAGALSTGYDTMLPVGDANKWWIGAGSSNAYSFGRTNADLSGGRMIGSGVYIAN